MCCKALPYAIGWARTSFLVSWDASYLSIWMSLNAALIFMSLIGEVSVTP